MRLVNQIGTMSRNTDQQMTPLEFSVRVMAKVRVRLGCLVFGFCFLFFVFLFLFFGFWFLVFGFWFLVFGFWFLVCGLGGLGLWP